MADIQPFSALYYNPDRVNLADVVVPPYDVISQVERQRLAAETHSGVRLTLAPEHRDDTEASNRYTRSRDLFRRWQTEGILIRDASPAFYVLRQQFAWDGREHRRMHLVGAARLHDWGEGVILPHEKILQGPKDDRQRLIEASRANYEPVFGLSMDTDSAFRDLIESHTRGIPMLDVTLANGERNAVWRVDGADAIAAIQCALAPSRIVIADGHHRYTASLGVRDAMRMRHGDGPWDSLMMTVAALDDPELLVLPTHRLVSGSVGANLDETLGRLDAYFVVREVNTTAELLNEMEAAPGVAFGMLAWPDSAFLLTPWKTDGLMGLLPEDHSDAWKRLDVSILHGVVMDRVLGLGAGENPRISYTRDAGEAEHAVNSGAARLAFLMKPTPTDAVRQVALNGETMPQKSTFFYPKLLTGLLMRAWDGGPS